jgi:hypothetical protein
MKLIAQIEAYKTGNAITAGPQGPRALAAPLLASARSPMMRRMILSQIRHQEFQLAYGSTITAVALGLHDPRAFDPQVLHMPVFRRYAPQGLQSPRSQIIKALAMQQLVGCGVMYAQLLGVCILLSQVKPREAIRLFMPSDQQGLECAIFALEMFVGLPVYGYVLAVEGACAAGQRVLDAWT